MKLCVKHRENVGIDNDKMWNGGGRVKVERRAKKGHWTRTDKDKWTIYLLFWMKQAFFGRAIRVLIFLWENWFFGEQFGSWGLQPARKRKGIMVGLNRLNGRNLKFIVLFKTIRDRDLGGGRGVTFPSKKSKSQSPTFCTTMLMMCDDWWSMGKIINDDEDVHKVRKHFRGGGEGDQQ